VGYFQCRTMTSGRTGASRPGNATVHVAATFDGAKVTKPSPVFASSLTSVSDSGSEST